MNNNLSVQKMNGKCINMDVSQYSQTLDVLSQLIVDGNLASLTSQQKLKYYDELCKSVNLNPLTRPFEFHEMGYGKEKKLVLYANKGCAEQLRALHNVSVDKVEHKKEDGLYLVTAHVRMGDRTDVSTGVIPFCEPQSLKKWDTRQNGYIFTPNPEAGKSLPLNDLANLIMKTETKAKRRATLSICGLGSILDESEIETIPVPKNITPIDQEEFKKEDYKLDYKENNKPTDTVLEKINKVKELIKFLGKEEGYEKKVVKSKFGHENIELVDEKFIDLWLGKLETQVSELKSFVEEMDKEI